MHRPIGLTRPHGHGSRVVSFQMDCTDFRHLARTSSRPCRMPVGSLGRRGAIHATVRKNMHVSCQLRRFFSKKNEKHVSRPETLFFVGATNFRTTLEARGGGAIRSRRWGDLPQGVGQIAPPPSGRIFCEDEPERGSGWGAQATAARGFTEPGATLPAPPGPGFRRCPRRDRPGRSSTAARTGAVR